MIRTLVVDDDFRVARIHAAIVERVDGFVCIGQAHTAAEAAAAISDERPDLLILDIYLPDMDGLALLRRLAADGSAPDTIFITASRDISTVRAAMGLGAVYYLVKPFGLPALQQQLRAYRQWREHLASGIDKEADQETVDSLFNLLRPRVSAASGNSSMPPTMARILHIIQQSEEPLGAMEIATTLGMSRATAQRYLSDLERRQLISLQLTYGAAGRPIHRYRNSAVERQ